MKKVKFLFINYIRFSACIVFSTNLNLLVQLSLLEIL